MNKPTCSDCKTEFPHPDFLNDGLCGKCYFAKEEGKAQTELWSHMAKEHDLHLLESEVHDIMLKAGAGKQMQIDNLTRGVQQLQRQVMELIQQNRNAQASVQALAAGHLKILTAKGEPPFQVARSFALEALANSGLKFEQPNGHAHNRIITG